MRAVADLRNNKFSGETNDAEGNKHSSEGDIFVYNLNEVDGYVATPNGSWRKYDYQSGEITVISTEMPSDIKDPNRLNHFPPYNISNFMKYLNKLSTIYK